MKPTVFLIGATGGMGFQGLIRMLGDADSYNTLIIVRDSEKNRKLLADYEGRPGLTVVWGDLTDYETVFRCVEKSDIALHVAAFVSPAADYYPRKARLNNFGSTRNLIRAIHEQKCADRYKLCRKRSARWRVLPIEKRSCTLTTAMINPNRRANWILTT